MMHSSNNDGVLRMHPRAEVEGDRAAMDEGGTEAAAGVQQPFQQI
jgi:hypothetical protein